MALNLSWNSDQEWVRLPEVKSGTDLVLRRVRISRERAESLADITELYPCSIPCGEGENSSGGFFGFWVLLEVQSRKLEADIKAADNNGNVMLALIILENFISLIISGGYNNIRRVFS